MANRKDLLSEAIADAKAVKETALANAKLALEEAFTPKLQSMISAKLAEEADEEMEEDLDSTDLGAGDNAEPADVASDSSDIENDDELTEEEGEEHNEEEVSEEEDELSEEDDEMSEEEDMDEEEVPADENYHEEEEAVAEEDDMDEEEEIDLDEVIKTLKEMEDDSEESEEEVEENDELEEAYATIESLQKTINEVNLLNAKLLFTNKLFRTFDLNENQKVKVLENFDRTSSVREVKLVFSTLAENLNVAKKKRTVVKEGYASKATKSSAPKKIISEGNDMAARWKKLAGLK